MSFIKSLLKFILDLTLTILFGPKLPKSVPPPPPKTYDHLPTFTQETYEEFRQAEHKTPLRPALDSANEYFTRLPTAMLSRCPFCAEPLLYHYDPFNLDSMWWGGGINMKPPRHACQHFVVLEGAFDLDGNAPPDVELSIEVGPDVPFAIPAFLKPSLNGIAVIHKITILDKYIGYPTGYFRDPNPYGFHLSRRGWTTDTGWGVDFEEHDYDLAPYILAGRVRWLDPNDPEHPVKQGKPEECPYNNLLGIRQRQRFFRGRRFLQGSPDGVHQPDPHGVMKLAKEHKKEQAHEDRKATLTLMLAPIVACLMVICTFALYLANAYGWLLLTGGAVIFILGIIDGIRHKRNWLIKMLTGIVICLGGIYILTR